MFQILLELPRYQKRIISICIDAICLSLALWLALTLRWDRIYFTENPDILAALGLTVVSSIFLFARLGLYRAVIRYMSNHAMVAILTGVTLSSLVLATASFMFGASLPRSVPFIYWCLALISVGGSRMIVRSLVHRAIIQQKERVIIYGAGKSGLQLSSVLFHGKELVPVAFVDDTEIKQGSILNGMRVYPSQALPQILKKYNATRVLLALGHASRSQRRLVLRFLETFPVKVQTIPPMNDVVSGKAKIEEIRDVEVEDLLGRDEVAPNCTLLSASIEGKSVMITGAGGSIGSELCRQIVRLRPRRIVLFELSEYGLYSIEKEVRSVIGKLDLDVELIPILGSIQQRHRVEAVMTSFEVQTVYHAAAYKHVPLVEQNLIEGIRNNVFGTWHTAEAAIKAGVERFVLISTDKAVRPTNMMGASKRLAELVLQGLANFQETTKFCMVRFGNVLGSSGSVVPLFREQITNGGPVTVTHPDIFRYFMTIPEAAQLVLQAGSMEQGGDVFVLDMGEQVRIADLARKMIHLMGLEVKDDSNPEGDVEIQYTGLRPGEKLYEELLIGDDPQTTEHARIMKAHELCLPWNEVKFILENLDAACHEFDCESVRAQMLAAPLAYSPNGQINDFVWNCMVKRAGDDSKESAKQTLPLHQKVVTLSGSK